MDWACIAGALRITNRDVARCPCVKISGQSQRAVCTLGSACPEIWPPLIGTGLGAAMLCLEQWRRRHKTGGHARWLGLSAADTRNGTYTMGALRLKTHSVPATSTPKTGQAAHAHGPVGTSPPVPQLRTAPPASTSAALLASASTRPGSHHARRLLSATPQRVQVASCPAVRPAHC